MAGATGVRLECPRCGRPVPAWQLVHARCFLYRVRAIVWMLAAAVAVPGGLYGFRWGSVHYERWKAAAPIVAEVPVAPVAEGLKLELAPPVAVAAAPPVVQATPAPPRPPAAAGSADAPEIRIGDRWVLRSDDLNNPKWSNVTERRVLQASSSELVVTSRNMQSNYTRTLVFSPSWNLIQSREPDGRGYDYAPPLKYFDFPLYPGKKWESEIQESPAGGQPVRTHHLSAVVEGWEDVTVPAGTFRSLKVVLRVKAIEGGVVTRDSEDVSWYASNAKRSVKTAESSLNHATGLRTMRAVSLVEFAVSP